MNEATHKLKAEDLYGAFPEYIKIVDDRVYSFNSISGKWWRDINIENFLDYYDEIDDLTETPEEKEVFDNWPSERRIDIIATNGNTGEHYNPCGNNK